MEFKLFVSNIPYNCTEEEFKTFLLTLDDVKSVKLVQKPNVPFNKGFGFVTVSSKEIHDSLIANDKVIFNGRKLKFTEYVNQKKFYKLHVMNVPELATEHDLFATFSKFGSVDSVKKDYVQFKGTAVVVYNNYEDFNTVLKMKYIPFTEAIMLTVTKRRLPFRHQYQSFDAPSSSK